MCGVFAYAGNQESNALVLQGLKNLEYRGYDSWGISYLSENKVKLIKQVGSLPPIQTIAYQPSHVTIGHTRWATHGRVSRRNAHPHLATDRSFCLVHNGIVENANLLKDRLIQKGFEFKTETDSEVIVRLIESYAEQTADLTTAIDRAFTQLEGRNALVIMSAYHQLWAVKKGSPLVLGLTQTPTEIYISSDTFSFAGWVKDIQVMEDQQLFSWSPKAQKIIDLKTRHRVTLDTQPLVGMPNQTSKQGYSHYMYKEIYQTPVVLAEVAQQSDTQLTRLASQISTANHVYTIGSGTAGVAASMIAYYLRQIAKIPAISLIGAEATSYYSFFSEADIVIAPSQSGETADVLEVLELAQSKGVKIATYVNMPGSMMTRMADYPFLANAGPEISVVSTKIFTSQAAWGYLLAMYLVGRGDQAKSDLVNLAETVDEYLHTDFIIKGIKQMARELTAQSHLLLLAKGSGLPIAQEGMIKLIEATYKHAMAIPAGDLKHYAITLIGKRFPVIVLDNPDYQRDLDNALHEVKARGATVYGIAQHSHPLFDFFLPIPSKIELSSLMQVIPLQLAAFYIGQMLGYNVDKPRHIAKSVTVR